MARSELRPPDLEMRVRTVAENGRTRLTYTLHSPTGVAPFFHREIPGPMLQGSPEDFQSYLLNKIGQLGERRDVEGEAILRVEIERKLAGLGHQLWRELFTPELQYAYRDIRRSVHTWLIISDEPWIPWELVKPFDDSRTEDLIDDDFLPLRYELTRWLAGDKTPSTEIAVRRLAVILTDAELPQSQGEQNELVALATRPGIDDASRTPKSTGALLAFLEGGGVDLLHFIGHGTFASGRAEESAIPLPDGSLFRPVDLEGPVAARIRRDRPLVFLNACWSGQQSWSLTRIGGWVAHWVGVCGSGAFVAPLWPVRDQVARSFAQVFYEALQKGATLGRAALQARQHLRATRGAGDISTLGYTVYGHPNARVLFGEEVPAQAEPDFAQAPPGTSKSSVKHKTFGQFVTDVESIRQERGLSDRKPPISPSEPQRPAPVASANLRIRKNFSDLEKDRFVEDAFELMGSFFESSLQQLEQQNRSMIATRFRRIDKDHFSATIYVQGEKRSACRIWVPKEKMGDIAYFGDDSGADNTYHEILWAENDGYSMWLRPGLQIFSSAKGRLSPQEASEYLWSMLMRRLQ